MMFFNKMFLGIAAEPWCRNNRTYVRSNTLFHTEGDLQQLLGGEMKSMTA